MCGLGQYSSLPKSIFFALIVTSFCFSKSYGAADFVLSPKSPYYVVEGGTASFVWTYHVDDRNNEFIPLSPSWFYRHVDRVNSTVEIGKDNRYIGWKFQTSNATCPPRLLTPIVRVKRVDQATLVVKSTILEDSGVYGCTLHVRPNNDITKIVHLIVTETPSFSVKPNATTPVVENKNLAIPCTAKGPPPPNITWVNVKNNNAIVVPATSKSATLRLSNIKRNQNGTRYECQAINNPHQGPTKTITTIVVYYPPEFTLLPANTTVTEGEDITLHCQATGNPSPTITWERENGVSIRPGFTIHGNGSITISKANKSDAGTYICTAKNVLIVQSHSETKEAVITVKYRPAIKTKSEDQVVNASDTVKLKCTANGNPTPTIKWSKSSASSPIIYTGESFNIKSVNKSDAGTYTCTASNGIGNDDKAEIHVIVQYKPTIDKTASSSASSASSWKGNTITLTCKYSDANPVPTWTWKNPNGDTINKEQHNITNGSKITIITQDSSDYGNYSCHATNAAGSVNHEVYVTQLFAPSQVNITIGDIEAVSVTVHWTKPSYNGGSPVIGYKLEIGQQKIENISKRFYTVSGLTKDKNYVIKLYAKNVVGYGVPTTENFTTKKEGPPASPKIISAIPLSPTSVKLTWEIPDDNGGEITHFIIYQKVDGVDKNWKQVIEISGTPLNTYTVVTLDEGTTYLLIVTARNKFGDSVQDASKGMKVKLPVATTTAPITTVAPFEPSKGKSSGEYDPNQPIIIAGAVVAVVLILVTVIISVIILKKKNMFGKGKRKSTRTENAAYHNDVHSDDSSGRQAAVIDLGDASATYAAVDTSKKTKNKPKEIATYAAVDKSKKKKKPGEIIYAELADFNTNYTPAENRPVKYLETDYADISQFQNQSEPEPTYANFPGRSKDYANVSDI